MCIRDSSQAAWTYNFFYVGNISIGASLDGRIFFEQIHHDYRVCAYPSYRAMLEIEGTPEYTSVCLLVDKEEIGSVGASGMQSRFFENCVAEVMNLSLIHI